MHLSLIHATSFTKQEHQKQLLVTIPLKCNSFDKNITILVLIRFSALEEDHNGTNNSKGWNVCELDPPKVTTLEQGDGESYQHCALFNILAQWTPLDQIYSSKEERIWDDKNDLWMEAVNRRNDEHAQSSDAEEQNMLL